MTITITNHYVSKIMVISNSVHYHKFDITTSKDKSMHEEACLRVDEFATKLRDVIELLILYRDLILLNFSLGTELIIIPRSIPAPNSD